MSSSYCLYVLDMCENYTKDPIWLKYSTFPNITSRNQGSKFILLYPFNPEE